ncbi:nucleoside hydrolase [Oceanomicrobium pacificus]|uniref:Nucleoside hydrolase n=1 Tax=Oceanomicrobium pacificus TaxID=2692916 RepID=A0A6B0TP60_9RHOB|nr:nucleoside hydrolase [Oceanomicrobium pacificus]MXU64389.1 nucleoside hydrolase [Oceanomicrobium pacificus]
MTHRAAPAHPGRKVRMVLDTDTFNEIDDQFALVYALLSPEAVTVEAIYAAPFSNSRAATPGEGMEQSYDEILRLLSRLGRDHDGFVFKGVTDYVGPAKEAREAPAVDDLIARARSATPDDPLYVVAIAAISNVTSALLKAPEIAGRIVVVWLGGHALHWPHTREFNLRQDIGGVQVLLDCDVPLVLVPCEGVVTHLTSTPAEIERYVEPHGDIGAFLAQRFKDYSDDHLGWAKEIWDMAAVAWLVNPDWCPAVQRSRPILSDNGTWSYDDDRAPMRYVRHVDRNAIFRDFFLKLRDFAGVE